MSDRNWPQHFPVADGASDFASLEAQYGHEYQAESEGRYTMMIPDRIPRDMQQYESL
ncbi:MAG: hypothetical protein HOI35_03510 [Woeseia sp.]|nr:hypothetical protein [Woeseia sp.]MBT6209072.1 hypothetical protein [Woeseia sp.]